MVGLSTIYLANFRLKIWRNRTGIERVRRLPYGCTDYILSIVSRINGGCTRPALVQFIVGRLAISLFQFLANIAGPHQICDYKRRTNENRNAPVQCLKSKASRRVRKSQRPIGFVKSSSVMLCSMLGTCHFNIYLIAADFKHEAGYFLLYPEHLASN